MTLTISPFIVDQELAQRLSQCVQSLPDFDYVSLCEDEPRQQMIYDQARQACGSALEELVAALHHQVTHRPYSVWLRGLTLDDRAWIVILLSIGLGPLSRPTTDDLSEPMMSSAEPVVIKNHHSFARLHTDGTNWERPNDLTFLACFAADQQGGGNSVILDVDTIIDLMSEDPSLLAALRTPLPWTISQDSGWKTQYYPILDEENRLRWLRRNIEVAQDWGKGEIAPETMAQISRFDDVIENTEQRLIFRLEANDILIMNNRKTLHGRTPIKGLSMSERRFQRTRLFLR